MIASILKQKCPRCHKGSLFVDSNPYNLSKMTQMKHHCEECGLITEPEPGFYFGAMYVSYALCTFIFVMNFFLLEVIFPLPGFWFIAVNSVLLLALWPWIFRVSRIIYLNFFVKYDPEAIKKSKSIV